ncbi:hypothetical protein Mapa_011797 [Marchantia paleacea]|nr:hypothetical protein Mapa_011797 [Marchantia paleacea]
MGQNMIMEAPLFQGKNVVETGVDRLLTSHFGVLQNAKVGVITNASGVFQNLKHLVDVLHEAPEVDLVAIFGPEHGFRSASQAGSSETFYIDPRTKLPVYDTYLKSGKLLSDMFDKAGVDILLFDIQDVGARFFTYIWTMYDCMVAAAASMQPIKFVVLDRPNPVGGIIVDGPLMKPAFSSFVGRKAIPMRHAMTVGELAMLFNAEYLQSDSTKRVDLEVVAMNGWDRSMYFRDTGLLWVPPSPNIPSSETCLFYLGMALFEGSNCSEGRGTALPFQMIGASWIDYHLVEHLQQHDCPGVLFREACFTPSSSKFASKTIDGLQVHITDAKLFNPIRTALTILCSLLKLYPKHFQWRVDGSVYWVDMLLGTNRIREGISRGESVDELMASWQDDVMWFYVMRRKYLIYV